MRTLALLGLCLLVSGCAQPRAHAGIHITPNGLRVVPSVSSSIAGIGVTVSE
ncbi:hypothetical protein [Albidovulum sp.]|uniref:hypothetical protein n=1 Tax=Albidovulum sp. TaxID=1872424 RepID=UPI0039B87F6B